MPSTPITPTPGSIREVIVGTADIAPKERDPREVEIGSGPQVPQYAFRRVTIGDGNGSGSSSRPQSGMIYPRGQG